ncbi:MAG TPA: SAV_915 family protein [Trebonia sp.]|nr:SAV_915 family protein [Trebonia sp.]
MSETFLVPVRTTSAGSLALRTGRLLTGERIGLAFTSEASLLLAMGPSQQWARLGQGAMRDMLAPLGISHIRIDPHPIRELEAGRPGQPGPGHVEGLPAVPRGLGRHDSEIEEADRVHSHR